MNEERSSGRGIRAGYSAHYVSSPDHLCQHFAPQLRAFLMQRLSFGSYPEIVTSGQPSNCCAN